MSPDTLTSAMTLNTTINQRAVSIQIEPREMLLDLLRDRLELTGAKRSCDSQVCGACTVLIDGEPVSACCTLAYEAQGREVETIEGLAGSNGLHPIQRAFVDAAAIQCGFCTPGFVLTTKALLAENPRPTRAEIEAFLGGNLCRCTGYWNILAAVEQAARLMAAENPHPNESPHPNPSPIAMGEGLSTPGSRGLVPQGAAIPRVRFDIPETQVFTAPLTCATKAPLPAHRETPPSGGGGLGGEQGRGEGSS